MFTDAKNIFIEIGKQAEPLCVKLDLVKPPLGLMWHLRRSLKWIDPDHFQGLDFIWLMDDIPKEGADEFGQRVLAKEAVLYGVYKAKEEVYSSYILLLLRYIYLGIPSIFAFTPVPTFLITKTLAHEVAHHLIATRGYVFQRSEDISDKESLANRYAESVLQKMRKRWYYRLGERLIKEHAETHYVFGIQEWKHERYCEAADRWYKAWRLNSQLENVVEWYFDAKEKCNSGRNRSLAE